MLTEILLVVAWVAAATVIAIEMAANIRNEKRVLPVLALPVAGAIAIGLPLAAIGLPFVFTGAFGAVAGLVLIVTPAAWRSARIAAQEEHEQTGRN